MSNEQELDADPRASGEIRRYHTWAIHNQQTVGEHTWQILRIMLTVWPNCPRHVLVYTVKHDMGEMAGDIPYPFKRMVPELKVGMDKAENIVEKRQRGGPIGIPELRHPLSRFEKTAFKAIENLEMYEFGWREYNMGNRYALAIINRMQAAFARSMQELEEFKDTKEYRDHVELIASITRYFINRNQLETDLAKE